MNDTFNPEFQTEVRPNWMPHPNPQQRRLQNIFVGGPTMYDVKPAPDQAVDVNHQVVQELLNPPIDEAIRVYVLYATYEDNKAPVDIVGVYSEERKAKEVFELLERYRDGSITFYLVEQKVQ